MAILSEFIISKFCEFIPATCGLPLEQFAKRLLLGLFTTTAFVYFLFQKKMLPKPISKIVSSIFFLPTFPITAILRIGNYWTVIDDTLILGCAPMGFLGHPKMLSELGVEGVVNMCSEYGGPTSYYSQLGIKQLRLPTVDHFEPSVESMVEAVKFIQEHKNKHSTTSTKANPRVYVHCKAGHGRAASIALCWLISQNPTVPLQELNQRLRKLRKVRGTLYQQKNIQDFHRRYVEEYNKKQQK